MLKVTFLLKTFLNRRHLSLVSQIFPKVALSLLYTQGDEGSQYLKVANVSEN